MATRAGNKHRYLSLSGQQQTLEIPAKYLLFNDQKFNLLQSKERLFYRSSSADFWEWNKMNIAPNNLDLNL